MNGQGVTLNAGLLGQRIRHRVGPDYIHLFGGDPAQVTLLGEPAGGSSIEAHIIAYGASRGRSPSKGAIVHGPYALPMHSLPNSRVQAVLNFRIATSVDVL